MTDETRATGEDLRADRTRSDSTRMKVLQRQASREVSAV
jgi:hypothetical protein